MYDETCAIKFPLRNIDFETFSRFDKCHTFSRHQQRGILAPRLSLVGGRRLFTTGAEGLVNHEQHVVNWRAGRTGTLETSVKGGA